MSEIHFQGLPVSMAAAEEALIRYAVRHFQGNVTKASEALGIGRSSIYRKLRAYGIPVERKAKE
jgi:DNA-binding NtrC family response regulator